MLTKEVLDGSLLVQFSAALLASFASIFFISWVARKLSSRSALPPGPHGLPLVGYLPFLGTDLHLTFAEDIAVGGTDTTAAIFEWTLTELLLHPQAIKLVQDELTEVVGLNNSVTESHLSKLKYLDAVVKETHRLHPALPLLIPRRPSKDTEVGGYRIPKDTTIFVNVWAIHRDPEVWDRPQEFRLERFLDGATRWDYSGTDLKYLPFGSGRRTCPGLPLAERALMYTLAMFLHFFDWEVPKGVKIGLEEKFGIVTKEKEPLVAIHTPRFSNAEFEKNPYTHESHITLSFKYIISSHLIECFTSD